MFDVKRKIQITLLVLVLVSSTLLGLSMESMRMIMIGVIGALLGFVMTDTMKWFRMEGVLANIASIVILVIAMHNFFSVDNAGKLECVANLLVYLQTVLMFQDKTPRLIWQVLVLSLLQVVVGAIFSLNLEAGVLFLIYFGVAGFAMLLQAVYSDAFDIQRRNRRSGIELRKLNRHRTLALSGAGQVAESELVSSKPAEQSAEPVEATQMGDSLASNQQLSRPLAFFDPAEKGDSHIWPMAWHLALWLLVSTVFTMVLFYMVPRHSEPWFGPANSVVSTAGVSKAVDLDERGLIEQSNRLVFRVNVSRVDTGEEIAIDTTSTYFRGLALSSLVIEDGKTNWRAPHDRVFSDLYQELPYSPSAAGIPVNQTITLEETSDPLIYGLMPFYRAPETPKGMSFCHEVSVITRGKLGDPIGMAPYTYTSQTLIDKSGKFCKAWPFISNTKDLTQDPMSDDPMQWKWLTSFDPARYPRLVETTNRIAAEVKEGNGSRLDLLNALESHFLSGSRFNYTLDFRDIEFDENTDPIEDFFSNHKSGHCELYASALTIMLRQQNIPARLVVGFHGVNRNNINGKYLVRARNAHAWVEAYLPPEDCTSEMFASGQAGPGGAWVILDSTPLMSGDGGGVGEEAIDLARSVWDDYVLGVETESEKSSSAFAVPLMSYLLNLDVDQMDRSFNAMSEFTRNPMFKYVVAGVLLFFMFLVWLRARLFGVPKQGVKAKKAGRLRRLVAGAISLISPGLGSWVMKGTAVANPTEFYSKLTTILQQHELEREPSQTHREFAGEVSKRFDDHPAGGLIQSTVVEVTELFNEVRFGRTELDPELGEQIDLSLKELETALG